jgi:HlyD family secretion protein
MNKIWKSLRLALLPMLVLALPGSWLALRAKPVAAGTPALTASGTIEAGELQVAPEISGRIAEVPVAEGDQVKAGSLLLRFEDQGLQSQRLQAASAGQAAIDAAQTSLDSAQQTLKALKDNAPVVTAQAQLALAQARKALDDAQRRRSYLSKGNRASSETLEGTQAQLVLANKAVDKAQAAVNKVSNLAKNDPVRAAAEAALLEARQQRDAIQSTLNWYKGAPTSLDQAILDAEVEVAQANVAKAELDYQQVKDGPDPLALKLAQDQVAAAESQVTAAKAASDASLKSIDLQLARLEVLAPLDGVVLSRSIDPGEVAQAGMPVLTIGQLDQLKVTVYIPEDRYGQIHLGDHASLAVDSYPSQSFDAVVSRIADQAEYTPSNVQTKEERQTTVYAVELTITDTSGKLIPGMPTDVTFQF